ncbi:MULTISPECIES: hypothetical protein [unclassified Enterococcus]|uniref:hypothetical protein n=1 Tax=unclassified Enterococcus TaxID=2608891 RepID=UPI001553A8A0|nr:MULTISPECIES: hypothetical protein [unclassified Enterococcus]MBS7578191.1 hypothetical protein [Enterococcus sp. MMGLQ5-2]MBS7585433.1 hypothetical protein [Enterococcus sp. MMGLQ5-1]NPD13290.1 hypothetical protein [Enterococcus sp. MMGLQ5-1]NPD38022.1 hypothetical protein [Enterococcus sp. MMGLQ5-2]
MGLFKVIDGLFVGTRYGIWGISLLGVIASIILVFFNIGMGLGAVSVLLSALALSVGLVILLLPAYFTKGKMIGNKRYITGSVFTAVAILVMGLTYFLNSGFPDLNLLFL